VKIEPKFYRIRVTTGISNAGLICVTYNLDTTKQFVGIEYYQIYWSFDDSGLNIPSSRHATFKEELRVLHNSASTYTGSRDDEKSHIKDKLTEAYGTASTVEFEEILLKN
jgi:hypothetical protein